MPAMPRSRTKSFIAEFPLVVRPFDEDALVARLEAGRRICNAVLGEALRRLRLMRESKAWQQAHTLKGQARSSAFQRCCKDFGFNEYALQAFATRCKNAAHFEDRLGANETQKLATRAFDAAKEYSLGKHGRPRFKSQGRPLHSIEGKTNATGLRWKRDVGAVVWGDLVLVAKLPPAGKDQWLVRALECPTKYVRLVWRIVGGRRRWFAQLVQKGNAPRKYETVPGAVVGLDVGPSTVAVVADAAAALVPLAPEVEQPWAKMRRIQRAMDRSRRATNPDCFNADGTFKRGAKIAVRSKAYEALRSQLQETERMLAATRKCSHGRLANQILGLGNIAQTELLSYRAFQGAFGRSTKVRAAGMFIAMLSRKAENAGGAVIELNTRKLRLSQYDHVSRTHEKKSLSQRWHALGDGSGFVQRDIYSAFLAQQCAENELHPSRVDEAWATAKPLLGRAGWSREECASVASLLATAPALPAPERIARQRRQAIGHARDAVAARREPVSPEGDSVFRTPWL